MLSIAGYLADLSFLFLEMRAFYEWPTIRSAQPQRTRCILNLRASKFRTSVFKET